MKSWRIQWNPSINACQIREFFISKKDVNKDTQKYSLLLFFIPKVLSFEYIRSEYAYEAILHIFIFLLCLN